MSFQVRAEALPARLYFVVSAVFHYVGPAFAVLLFTRVDLLGVAWIRIASAALVFAAWKRPWRQFGRLRGADMTLVVSLGATLATMNVCFYEAINKLPLGTVAAIEFLGPIAIAAAGTRTRRNAIAFVLAVFGIYFLTHLRSAESRSATCSRSLIALYSRSTSFLVIARRQVAVRSELNVSAQQWQWLSWS